MNYTLIKQQFSTTDVIGLLKEGTICTPLDLIEEIVEKLPIKWDNPRLTFLDPACGRGAFLFVIKQKLLQAGHSEQHIVENMLYGIDIDQQNTAVAIAFVDPSGTCKNNIECTDALKKEYNMKFDVIVGNPPYQRPESLLDGEKKNSHKPFWFLFTEQAFSWATPEIGIVCFITPSSWLQHTSNIHTIIVGKELHYAKVFSKSPFGHEVGTTASYWIAYNRTRTTSFFNVSFDELIVHVEGKMFLPVKAERVIDRLNILSKTVNGSNKKLDVRTTMKHHTFSHKDRIRVKRYAAHPHPVFHNNNTRLWSSIQDSLHGQWKVLVSKTGSMSRCIIDRECSVSESAVAMCANSKTECIVLQSILLSKLYKFLVECVRTNSTLSSDFLRNLPAVDLTRSWSDAELYSHFNLTQEEIKLIEETTR